MNATELIDAVDDRIWLYNSGRLTAEECANSIINLIKKQLKEVKK